MELAEQGVQRRIVFVVNFFRFVSIFVAIFDLVHEFHGHHSYFRKDFQMLLAVT